MPIENSIFDKKRFSIYQNKLPQRHRKDTKTGMKILGRMLTSQNWSDSKQL